MELFNNSAIAIAWCLAWGDGLEPRFDLSLLKKMRQSLSEGTSVPEEVQWVVDAIQQFKELEENEASFPDTLDKLKQLPEKYPVFWNSKIGLVYGGATKIKQYVFEESKLQDIQGASALLDRINLVDLPAFFNQNPDSTNLYTIHCQKVREWLNENFPIPFNSDHQSSQKLHLSDCLIPELIIYSTGGNILAFCPVAFVDILADAIEKRYTHETLTANSCAVGCEFRILETRFGVLRDPIETTPWVEQYQQNFQHPLVQACLGLRKLATQANQSSLATSHDEVLDAFKNRKSFNELTTQLAILFNRRRSGNDFSHRPSRRYPPMFETHPYLRRDESQHRLAITQGNNLPKEPYFSEASFRKQLVGNRAKTGNIREDNWYKDTDFYQDWKPEVIQGWVNKFEAFLNDNPAQYRQYYTISDPGKDKIAELENIKLVQSLTHLSKVCNGFVAYIYADANNMGGFIQTIKTPQKYQELSQDIFQAIESAVYQALAETLHPRVFPGSDDLDVTLEKGDLVHPFEIITIGGDDVLLIVPADKALEIAKRIGELFEDILTQNLPLSSTIKGLKIKGNYQQQSPRKTIDPKKCHSHRYSHQTAKASQCQLSMSIGVLITTYTTPIYYGMKLSEQLLKSAKKYAKKITKGGYYGGTIDFLTLKSVTMISSNIADFRENALTKKQKQKLKLYASPYTFHEIGGLIAAVKALKQADFPKSQLYQIRNFLEQGKNTAILNYCYFRTRLKQGKAALTEHFEKAWCSPKEKDNKGNLAPWMSLKEEDEPSTIYETIWRDMVDIYSFLELSDESNTTEDTTEEVNV